VGPGSLVIDVCVTYAVLTGSERTEGSALAGGRSGVGKTHLVATLQALLEQRLVALPDTSEGRQLTQELQDFELRVNENANLVSGAFRTGAHDDLVVALGLSCLSGRPAPAAGRERFSRAVPAFS